MATVVSATDIPPGGEGKIEVKVSTRGRKGKLAKSVTVYSNDPANPRYTLKVSGEVEVLAGFEPGRLDLKNIALGEKLTRTVQIVSKDLDKLKISEVTSSKPESVTAKLIEKDGKPALEVAFLGADKPGRISARVTAKTNLDKVKELQLYVYGQVSADLVTNRSYVFFPHTMGGKEALSMQKFLKLMPSPLTEKNRVIKLEVSSLSEKPFKIRKIEDPEGAVIGIAKPDNGKWLVALMLIGKPKTPRGMLKLHTDRQDQSVIEVRYGARSGKQPLMHPKGKAGMKPKRLVPPREMNKNPRIRPKMKKLPVRMQPNKGPNPKIRMKPKAPASK